jgi:hypothetical protein
VRTVGQRCVPPGDAFGGSDSFLHRLKNSFGGSVSVLYRRTPSFAGRYRTLTRCSRWRRPSVSMLKGRLPWFAGSFGVVNSCRNDGARQFGSLTGLRTAETRGGAFGPGVFAIAFHSSAVRPSRRTKKPDSLAILLLTGAAAPRRESCWAAGCTARGRVGEMDGRGARGQRGGEHVAGRWSRGRRGVSRGIRPGSRWRPGGRRAGEAGARGGWGFRRVRETEGGIRSPALIAPSGDRLGKWSHREYRTGSPGFPWPSRGESMAPAPANSRC